MGLFEDKIKQEIMQNIFADSLKMYETIDNKFTLSPEEKQKILEKISTLNNDLNTLIKDIKLS
ncbi:chromosome partition protein [Arcobacter nitrofigilis DSM 7299]|uniref:Chromosome partition protein n=1 Tax=Arcobacter nitrofigilis (strain ATCC 33309 / DSM 7299 / CCUG 15893 / LMG 7604 / NCTC 12251 / CI) TaxID=572480 RepID=D5V4X7_ARCNC|nr:hypothetical protein [Arcobacter nitrofigilis]ADG91939.1 chromosome partition protein [Arcobacter nitrofigilis DSM 7299]